MGNPGVLFILGGSLFVALLAVYFTVWGTSQARTRRKTMIDGQLTAEGVTHDESIWGPARLFCEATSEFVPLPRKRFD